MNTQLRRFLTAATAASMAATMLVVVAAPAAADTNGGCNSADPIGFGGDPQLTANIAITGNTAAYSLQTTDESPIVDGVPGLIDYCVYTPSPDGGITTDAQITAFGWTDPSYSGRFSWGRPDGNPSNLPFDGTLYNMGTATWSGGVPTGQQILLHINDGPACSAAGAGNVLTCFVLPGTACVGDTCGGGGEGVGLGIDKSASGAYDTTYGWTITKAVDKTKVEQIGGSATFNYTVTASYDTGNDGTETVSGTITVTNLNADPVTADVTDQLTNAANTGCTVVGGTGAVLASGDTPFDYSCPAVTLDLSMQNTGTVTWAGQTLSPSGDVLAGGHADATVDIAPVTQTLKDTCVDVTDTFNGGSAQELGNVCVGNSPAASNLNPSSLANFSESFSAPTFTFKYSRSISVPAHGCLSYPNTAGFTTNDTATTGSAGPVTVQVCGPANTGALTIGFWKTTNGQNLVNTYCGSGTTGLGYYLDHLGAGAGPFSNAPATCSLLKTYVFNILNGANAKDMNSMLKAQMLGTALDVWFSGPGWTSTTVSKVKPPSGFLSHNTLGSFLMDTTTICPMVDNTTAGTASCKLGALSTNAYVTLPLSAASLTMQQLLDYASTTPVPFNGSTSSSNWYSGNKTKEEVLKNIFDQFNNGDAFAG